jgi:hypothetical protein
MNNMLDRLMIENTVNTCNWKAVSSNPSFGTDHPEVFTVSLSLEIHQNSSTYSLELTIYKHHPIPEMAVNLLKPSGNFTYHQF